MALDEEVVEEAATLAGIALDEREVLGREDDRAQDAEDLAGALHGSLVDSRAVGAPRRDLDLEHERAILTHDVGPDYGPLGAMAHQRGVGGDAVAAERRQVGDGLDQVGLALTVRPDEGIDPRLEAHLEVRVVADVCERDVPHPHRGIGGCAHLSRRGAPA